VVAGLRGAVGAEVVGFRVAGVYLGAQGLFVLADFLDLGAEVVDGLLRGRVLGFDLGAEAGGFRGMLRGFGLDLSCSMLRCFRDAALLSDLHVFAQGVLVRARLRELHCEPLLDLLLPAGVFDGHVGHLATEGLLGGDGGGGALLVHDELRERLLLFDAKRRILLCSHEELRAETLVLGTQGHLSLGSRLVGFLGRTEARVHRRLGIAEARLHLRLGREETRVHLRLGRAEVVIVDTQGMLGFLLLRTEEDVIRFLLRLGRPPLDVADPSLGRAELLADPRRRRPRLVGGGALPRECLAQPRLGLV